MERTLLVDVEFPYIDLAVLEDGQLVEYQRYTEEDASIVSNIYIGRIINIIKGMEAAFIDIGLDKNAYLKLNSQHRYQQGQEVLVQVIKPPYKSKGAVVTTNISIPGKYVVIKPYDTTIYVSSKITDTLERERLKEVIYQHRNSNYGYIVRTDAVSVDDQKIIDDIKQLEKQWDEIDSVHSYRSCYSVLYSEPSPLIRAVKDLLTEKVNKFIINDTEQYDIVKNYIDEYYPYYSSFIELYEDTSWHLFNLYKVKGQLDKALKKHVWLKSGASIVIESTEALVSIDVNTAKFTGKKLLEDTIFKVNKEACYEIARQIRVRNLSGIIIIDFIDMRNEEHNQKVIQILKHALKNDRLKTVVLGMTKLGLVEMTRKKVSEPLYLQLKE
ncbi:Rne/Rng family ribonuclease [Vallitalea okinawensis]|uniref:Rne/Rng family ribonuclease n=1 Tax=Vallitalea okinawensis TaxID=2078660 RepID=UPI00130023FA|nr:ribonuclease E/G [Vallitalea okinawensis]